MLTEALPDAARLWCYTADRPLSAEAQARLLDVLRPFLQSWKSHGRPVKGEAVVLHDRFLLIAGDIPGGDLSGCGIDASVHALEAAARDLGFTWASALNVAYRDETGAVQVVPRPVFRRLVQEGQITHDTPVFDTTLATAADLRADRFERPAGEAWHGQVFHIPQPA